MKLLTLNLFTRNYQLCIGKMLSLVRLFSDIDSSGGCDLVIKEFICICLFLLLKLKNTEEDNNDCLGFNSCIDNGVLFDTLKSMRFVTVVGTFMVNHILSSQKSFILVKFGCDIIFEYLYHVELLSDQEFHNLVSRTELIPSLIQDLLSNNSFDDYDINDPDWEDGPKLIAYEEFKLLLMINEQYLMKSFRDPSVRNKVFDSLMASTPLESEDSANAKIALFMNLLVFHLNREESHIIKILILKFLYLIFTSSYTAKLYYLNDLKILVDIFVRELNDILYIDRDHVENRILIITYLKVLYPMLIFSQLGDRPEGYKQLEIITMLSQIIINTCTASTDESFYFECKQLCQINSLAERCLSVPWLKQKKKPCDSSTNSPQWSLLLEKKPSSSDLLSSGSSDSIANSFAGIASVRSSNRADYHRHTTIHNDYPSDESLVTENNGNIFLDKFHQLSVNDETTSTTIHEKFQRRNSNILDLPHEYLETTPKLSTKKSSLFQKALKKRAPAPPSPNNTPISHQRSPSPYVSISKDGSTNIVPLSPGLVPPPPPPPRRRRVQYSSG